MERTLQAFIAVLRRHGLRISPPEAADAARAVALAGYARQALHTALACTLVKSHADHAVFEQCFERFFHFAADTAEAADTAASPSAALALPGNGQAGGGGGNGAAPVPGVPPSALGERLLAGEGDALAQALAQAVAESRLDTLRVMTQKGLYGRRVLQALGLEDLERELAALTAQATPAALARAQQLRAALLPLRAQVRRLVDRQYRLLGRQDREAQLRETDFSLLRDSAETTAVIRRLARKLITRHLRRERRALRGRLDVRATLRRNLAHDGVLMEPRWRRIRRDRPRVLAVCDVSGSVSRHARFLLLFLHSLQEVIPQLRTFVFAASLHEVTDLFARLPLEQALDEVMARHGMGSTDYGRALADLERLTLGDIDRRSTLLFLGDARNNFGEPRLDLLQRFHARARQLVWLNPEERQRWGSGDSEMLRYLSCCTQAFSCRNLGELERIVDRLLRSG